MKPIDLIYNLITPYAPGIAEPTMNQWIRQAAIEFCERTRLWRYDETLVVTQDTAQNMTMPADSEIFEIESASFNDAPLRRVSVDWLDKNWYNWRNSPNPGQSSYLVQIEPGTIRLVPSLAGTADLHLFLKPSQSATTLPDFIVDKYRETIAWGALGRILMIPNQSFSSDKLAMYWESKFATKLDTLFTKGRDGEQRAPKRSKASFY